MNQDEMSIVRAYKTASFASLVCLIIAPLLWAIPVMLRLVSRRATLTSISSVVFAFMVSAAVVLAGKVIFFLIRTYSEHETPTKTYWVAYFLSSIFVLVLSGVSSVLLKVCFGWVSIFIMLACPLYYFFGLPTVSRWKKDLEAPPMEQAEAR